MTREGGIFDAKSVAAMVLLLAVVIVAACADNSIDTRVEPQSGSSLTFPVELTDARIQAGESLYAANCSACHGPVSGPTVLDSAPIHSDAGHTWHHPDRLLHQWILDKPPLATLMPAFRGTLSDEQVIQVLAYIKSQWLPEIQTRQNEGSVQYEVQVVEFGTE
ncbi:MAG: c-type cytochrome [Dehalococcoidia bacterium]